MAAPKRKDADPGTIEIRQLSAELRELRTKLRECEDTLAAIRGGDVDAIVVSGGGQEQVFTLAGTENAYRVFVEAMDEGAVTVNSSGVILYANRSEEHTSELQSPCNIVCRLLLEQKNRRQPLRGTKSKRKGARLWYVGGQQF